MVEAAGLNDAGALLADCAREILEQARAIPSIDVDLGKEASLVVSLPAYVDEARWILTQRRDVAAIIAVDCYSPSKRNVTNNAVAGNRVAALG